eukprot:3158956-Pleurochrysis_carterae.AAC.1
MLRDTFEREFIREVCETASGFSSVVARADIHARVLCPRIESDRAYILSRSACVCAGRGKASVSGIRTCPFQAYKRGRWRWHRHPHSRRETGH